MSQTRNFCIIAHIDHGKSTLADRILELTHTVSARTSKAQMLDAMDIERERGITIKAQAVRVEYQAKDGQNYHFNLIDTPGHVDFSYEVSRSLAACEGALLVVDAAQGVEAQTVANAAAAINAGLTIIPVLNKIDLPAADVSRVKSEIEEALAIPAQNALLISAKTGEGVTEVLEAIVSSVPAPEQNPLVKTTKSLSNEDNKSGVNAPDAGDALRALIFDSYFDTYRGVIALVRVFSGELKPNQRVKFIATGEVAQLEEVGVRRPGSDGIDNLPLAALQSGEVGYVVCGVKDTALVKVGDTIASDKADQSLVLPGYKEIKPFVYAGLYPIDADQYADLKDALEKLQLNDASLDYAPETSHALGFGFRVGFLGMLHMEVVAERLEREFNLNLLTTAPSVEYHIYLVKGSKLGQMLEIHSPKEMPEVTSIDHIEEPYLVANVITSPEYIGAVMDLNASHRGEFIEMNYLSAQTVEIKWMLPLLELICGYYDALKSRTSGYATLDYDVAGYQTSDLVKLDVLLQGSPVDALSTIVHKDFAQSRGMALVKKLKEIIPRQMYEVRIQAAIGGKILAAERTSAKRKDVTAKCYGGDITRKKKLLEKQKEGKKRMKNIGNVEVPQSAFLAVLKSD